MYQKYLKKLDAQELEIDKLTEQQKKLMSDEFKRQGRSDEDFSRQH